MLLMNNNNKTTTTTTLESLLFSAAFELHVPVTSQFIQPQKPLYLILKATANRHDGY
jgi:hypothetical protein